MSADIISFYLRGISKKIRSLITEQFEPFAIYKEETDLLFVKTENCSYYLKEKPPFWGGVMYENHVNRNNIVGFQLYGIGAFLRRNEIHLLAQGKNVLRITRLKKIWNVGELVQRIAAETEGGLETMYGDNTEEVKRILREHPNLTIGNPLIY